MCMHHLWVSHFSSYGIFLLVLNRNIPYIHCIYGTIKWKTSHKGIPQKMWNIFVAGLYGIINRTCRFNQVIVSIRKWNPAGALGQGSLRCQVPMSFRACGSSRVWDTKQYTQFGIGIWHRAVLGANTKLLPLPSWRYWVEGSSRPQTQIPPALFPETSPGLGSAMPGAFLNECTGMGEAEVNSSLYPLESLITRHQIQPTENRHIRVHWTQYLFSFICHHTPKLLILRQLISWLLSLRAGCDKFTVGQIQTMEAPVVQRCTVTWNLTIAVHNLGDTCPWEARGMQWLRATFGWSFKLPHVLGPIGGCLPPAPCCKNAALCRCMPPDSCCCTSLALPTGQSSTSPVNSMKSKACSCMEPRSSSCTPPALCCCLEAWSFGQSKCQGHIAVQSWGTEHFHRLLVDQCYNSTGWMQPYFWHPCLSEHSSSFGSGLHTYYILVPV